MGLGLEVKTYLAGRVFVKGLGLGGVSVCMHRDRSKVTTIVMEGWRRSGGRGQ